MFPFLPGDYFLYVHSHAEDNVCDLVEVEAERRIRRSSFVPRNGLDSGLTISRMEEESNKNQEAEEMR